MSITRRNLLQLAATSSSAFAQPKKKPNLLFLMSDQHRGDCMGAAGNPVVRTPHMDRIGREGVRFTAAYSSTPTCTPARACLLTGMSPWNHGMLGYSKVAQQYPVEKPRVLKNAGYFTAAIGKLHYSPQRHLHGYDWAALDESGRVESIDFRSDYRSWFATEAPGLDPDATGLGFNDYDGKPYVLPERLHPTAWTGDVATRFIEQYNRPEPFFLKVSFARPHSPFDPPGRLFKKYFDKKLPKAAVGSWASGLYSKPSSERADAWHGDFGEAQVHRSRAGYYGAVEFVDEQIGRILDALENRGMLEDTLVIYTSDHGDMTGDHHLWRKSYAYEASARIPLLMRWPAGLVSGTRDRTMDQPVELRDILATLADAGEARLPREIDGRSLLDLVRRNGEGWRQWIDLEHDVCYSKANHWNALTDGKRKYIFHAQNGAEQFFDLAKDPEELRDLAGDMTYAAELRIWRSRMTEHLAARGQQFVSGGKLALRPESMLLSPNHPTKR
jgi:arylsulfatase A-like enzyme